VRVNVRMRPDTHVTLGSIAPSGRPPAGIEIVISNGGVEGSLVGGGIGSRRLTSQVAPVKSHLVRARPLDMR